MRLRDSRLTVLELTNEIGWILCPFCRFNKPGYSCCDAPECEHPLVDWLPHTYDFGMEPGSDCWGFRLDRELSMSDVADLVGFGLREGLLAYQLKDGKLTAFVGKAND